MSVASSDARKTTALAISSGFPSLPSGTTFEIIFNRCCPVSEEPTSSQSPAASVEPGLTALTRIRRLRRSVAHPRANERPAASVSLETPCDSCPSAACPVVADEALGSRRAREHCDPYPHLARPLLVGGPYLPLSATSSWPIRSRFLFFALPRHPLLVIMRAVQHRDTFVLAGI